MGHVGVGGLTSSMRRGVGTGVGNGGMNECKQKFVGIGGLQSSGTIGVSSFSHINMLRLVIDDRRRMSRGVPVQNIDVRKVHFNSFVGFGGSSLGKHQRQDITRNDDDDVSGGNDVGSCRHEEFGGDEEFCGEGLGGEGPRRKASW